MFFSPKVTEDGNSYLISRFPIYSFSTAVRKEYSSNKIAKIFVSAEGLLDIAKSIPLIGPIISGLHALGITIYNRRTGTIRVHKFFIPELLYLLVKLNFSGRLINTIKRNTWVKDFENENLPNRADLERVHQQLNVKLFDWQREFLMQYDILRTRYQLRGYLLSFDQGLGKTITALSLMVALGKKQVIILAPKNTLEAVWASSIQQFFRKKKTVSLSSDRNFDPHADFLIGTYNSIDKLTEMASHLREAPEDIGIIVDESHNFLRMQSTRTQVLVKFREAMKCEDILMMSGTPVKAMGAELIPLLLVLDRYFDEEAMKRFKMGLGLTSTIGLDIIRNRLATMMHRRLKVDVADLPAKIQETLKIKIKNGDRFTVDNVKKMALAFAKERLAYHQRRMPYYRKTFYALMEELVKSKRVEKTSQFLKYLSIIEAFQKKHPSTMDPVDMERIRYTTLFEREYLYSVMTNEEKKIFVEIKAAVKYVNLKVNGEVIGQLFTRLRKEMTAELVAHSPMLEIMREAEKKTVIFTSFLDVVNVTKQYVMKHGFTPLVVTGENMKDVRSIIDRFIKEAKLNPIIATDRAMSTGVTLTVANVVIFLNLPWRHTDRAQAEDRIHRIGQDTTCYIYTIILDTDGKPNLSTRMEDIMIWSKEMFDGMVGDVVGEEEEV